MKKNEKRLLFIIIIVAYLSIGIIAGLAITILTSDPYSKTSIKLYKERCYDIYNEGIVKTQECLGYDNININSSSHEDQNILYNQGLKYVEHLDLMEFELFNTIKDPFKDKEIPYEKIKFTEKKFLIYDGRDNPFYLKITVDREHIDDITYYEYEECWDFKILIKAILHFLIMYFILSVWTLIIILRSANKTIKVYDEDEKVSNEE